MIQYKIATSKDIAELMPTFSHPTGRRAHLMNVYTSPDYRGQGIAQCMVELLIEEAQRRDVTEISLDATASGRPLYRKLGFRESKECMVQIMPDSYRDIEIMIDYAAGRIVRLGDITPGWRI